MHARSRLLCAPQPAGRLSQRECRASILRRRRQASRILLDENISASPRRPSQLAGIVGAAARGCPTGRRRQERRAKMANHEVPLGRTPWIRPCRLARRPATTPTHHRPPRRPRWPTAPALLGQSWPPSAADAAELRTIATGSRLEDGQPREPTSPRWPTSSWGGLPGCRDSGPPNELPPADERKRQGGQPREPSWRSWPPSRRGEAPRSVQR